MLASLIKPEAMDPLGHSMPLLRNIPRAVPFDAARTMVLTLVGALLLLPLSAARGQINPGIIDPTNAYAGKTYGQLAAGWWQYFMSLPMTNSPLNFIDGN